MSVTNELDELIALHGNCRDALNVTLAKLRQAESEIAVLKEAAQQSAHQTETTGMKHISILESQTEHA